MYGNVSLDYWYTQDPLSWKPTAQRGTAGKEQDKELGKYANPVLLCLLMALAMCKDTDALKSFVAALASSAHSQTPTREATDTAQ